MKVVAVMNLKGGIGKTTTATTLAYILGHEWGHRVLMVDGDAQGNASSVYGCNEPESIGMSELLEHHKCIGGDYITQDLIRKTDYEEIDLIPANGYLMRTNMNLLMDRTENQIMRFKEALVDVERDYDYCICDCGLLMDMTVLNILTAADLVIAPTKVGGFEIDAVEKLQEQVGELRSMNPKLRVKVLMTMRQGNKTSAEVEEWLKESSGYGVFATSVRRSIVAEKATMRFCPLPACSKRALVTADYRAVADELINGMEE